MTLGTHADGRPDALRAASPAWRSSSQTSPPSLAALGGRGVRGVIRIVYLIEFCLGKGRPTQTPAPPHPRPPCAMSTPHPALPRPLRPPDRGRHRRCSNSARAPLLIHPLLLHRAAPRGKGREGGQRSGQQATGRGRSRVRIAAW